MTKKYELLFARDTQDNWNVVPIEEDYNLHDNLDGGRSEVFQITIHLPEFPPLRKVDVYPEASQDPNAPQVTARLRLPDPIE